MSQAQLPLPRCFIACRGQHLFSITGPRPPARFEATSATDPQAEMAQPVHELAPLRFEMIQGRDEPSRRWNEFMARYHYLGYTPLSGHQMRYTVYAGDQRVAQLAFGAGAWTLADRDQLIGWTAE